LLYILWDYRVRMERVREFEEQYGADGVWARFFRAARGYRETRLLRDRETPGRYVTIDVWDDPASFRSFSETNTGEYKEIDRRCEELTEEERCLGSFETR